MQITIEKLVYGGSGIARTDQGIVFVPRTAPGDVVEVEVTDRKADYSVARVMSLVEPSPDRQSPSCPNYETAGCCHWQHIRYDRQVAIKESILRETLQRVGRIAWDSPIRVITGPDAHYRLRASFHVKDHLLGFVQEHSHTVVPIPGCSALAPELNAFVSTANTMLASPEMAAVIEVHAVAAGSVAAAFVSDNGKTRLHQMSPEPPRAIVNGITFNVHPDAFFQSNRYLLEEFMREVVEQVGETPSHVLDLFCGSGFFSIPIARRAKRVLGVESNRVAVRQALANTRLNDVWNAEFFEGQVDATLKEADLRPDVVVLNPPRAGCGKKTAERLAGLRAGRVVYVSCNPSTFAREAAVLIAGGYKLQRITMVDQFPNTYHIELVAQFDRN